MELKDFIAQTIKQVAEGVAEGHRFVVEKKLGKGVYDQETTNINFDVAVLSDEETKIGGSGKITVASIVSAGGGKEHSQKSSNHSRIKFEISVWLKTGAGGTEISVH